MGMIMNLNSRVSKLRGLLHTQDNRATKYPLYCVQEKRRVFGVDPRYHDVEFVWFGDDGTECATDEDFADMLVGYYEYSSEDALRESCSDDPVYTSDGVFRRVPCAHVWEFVTAHFTEFSARSYISQNEHNLREPRIFVTSQHRCYEWCFVVDGLMSGEIAESGEGSALVISGLEARIKELEGLVELYVVNKKGESDE